MIIKTDEFQIMVTSSVWQGYYLKQSTWPKCLFGRPVVVQSVCVPSKRFATKFLSSFTCPRVFVDSFFYIKIIAFRNRLSLISEDYFVFSIDSYQTNDLDDALHCRVLCEREGIYEVGIHITDVAHIVKPNTEDDDSARKL